MRNLSIAAQRRAKKSQEQSDRAVRSEAHAIADRIADLPHADQIEAFGESILTIMHGCSVSAWIVLDEKPGLFGYMNDRFYMLRQVRNHPDYGRRMLKNLKK